MRKHFLISLMAVCLSGCSAAGATQLDAENDLHCAVLSEAFKVIAADQNVPVTAGQRKAIAALNKWYGKKLVEIAKVRGPDEVLAEAELLGTFIENNLPSLKDETVTCITRANKEMGLRS